MKTQGHDRPAALDTLALGQTILVALLLVTQFLPQPEVSSGVAAGDASLSYGVPVASFVVMAISLAAGYSLSLAGALRSPWQLRFPVIVLVTGLLAVQPITSLTAGSAGPARQLQLLLSWAQLGILIAFWLWAAVVTVTGRTAPATAAPQAGAPQAGAPQAGAPQAGAPQAGGRLFGWVLLLLLAYYGLECGIWLAFVLAGQMTAGAGIVLHSIGAEVLLLPLVLVLPILAFSTTSVDHAQRIVRHFLFLRPAEGKRRRPFLLPVLTAVIAAGMLAYEFWQAGKGLLAGLVAVLILAGIMAPLVRLARIDEHWPQEVRQLWVFVVAAFFFTDTVLLVDLNPFGSGLPNLVVSTAALLLRVPLALAALTLALFLIMKARPGKPDLGAGGLLLAMVALIVLALTYPAELSSAGLSAPQPADFLGAVIICAAAATLAWLGILLKRRTWSQETARLRTTLLLLAGLLIVRGGYALLQLTSRLGSRSTVLLAAIFLLPPLWGYLTPVAQQRLAPAVKARAPWLSRLLTAPDDAQGATSADDPAPGQGRQPLLTGYVLICNCLFLYLGTFRDPVSGAVLPSFLTSDLTASVGLLLLAPPVVVLGFILRSRHRIGHAPPVPPDGAARADAERARRRVVAAGVIVTAAVTAAVFAVAFPRTLHRSENQPYVTAAPGPGCDNGDATWAVARQGGAAIDCTRGGLRLTVPAKDSRVMTFVPPSGVFVQNYRTSVRIDFLRLANGCISIATRMSAAGYYRSSVCHDGSWMISQVTGTGAIPLTVGGFRRANNYDITVTDDGPDQRLAIDGIQVASVSDRRFSGTQHLGFGIVNNTGHPGLAVLSGFVFTPLGQSDRVSAREPYLAAMPGPTCDKGAAQWALLTSPQARVSCPAGGTKLTISANGAGLIGFTPPSGVFPPNYRVSVRVNMAGLHRGCGVLAMFQAGDQGYEDKACPSGLWVIYGITLSGARRNTVVLAHGQVAPAQVAELQATVAGRQQRLAIDGAEVGEVPAISPLSTELVLLAAGNGSGTTGSAVFSDFAFVPLR